MITKIQLENGLNVEIISKTDEKNCVTITQRITDDKNNFLSKSCFIRCEPTGKTLNWTCPDDKDCSGDCTDPNNPRGGCY